MEDLNLLYGAISWDQIYLAIMVWALELMEDKYRQLRQHMKFNLPGTTKELLENPIDTLDQIIRMVTKWDGTQVSRLSVAGFFFPIALDTIAEEDSSRVIQNL
jgi:hypothetical protein